MNVRVEAVGETTSLADRKRRAGQRLVLGFEEPHLTDDTRRLVRELQPAGFVIRRRNVQEPEQVRELLRELSALGDPHAPALLGVDQEGGRVQAVRAPATEWPSMRALGRSGVSARSVGEAIAREMASLGFHWLFGPVADVDRGNSAIGDRSFGDDPARVSSLVGDFVNGVHAAGLIACPKHFPGHGAADGDSHERLPVAERDGRELRAVDLAPFREAIARGAGCLMTAHVLFPEWDEDVPASLSPRVVQRILRQELGYRGVVVTDDLDMAAVKDKPEAWIAERATRDEVADLLMMTDALERQHALFEALVRAQEEHPTLDRAAERAVGRVEALRVRFLRQRPVPPPVTILGTHHRLAAEVAERGGA